MSGLCGVRLDARSRRLLYAVTLLVAASGLTWIALGAGLGEADYADPRRVWRHRLLILHGVAAYILVWQAGSLFPRHQAGAWRARRNRSAGLALAILLAALAGSGLTLYYPPRAEAQAAISLAHQGLGAALLPVLILHAHLGRRSRPVARKPRALGAGVLR